MDITNKSGGKTLASLTLASELQERDKYMRKINVVSRKEYHFEQFDIVGK